MAIRELTIKDKITFGQYNGLEIREIFQGRLNIDRDLTRDFLDEILNNKPEHVVGFPELQFIDRFEIDNQRINVVGQIFNETEPLTEHNRVFLRNLEQKIYNYINYFWNKNNLGILRNIIEFAKDKNRIAPLGGDPEYLIWCEKNISEFQLIKTEKEKLENLKVCRFMGINILYRGNNVYEYREIIKLEKFKFN